MDDKIMTVTEAARNFADTVNRAYYNGESVTLIKNGKSMARIVPAELRLMTGAELAAIWADFPVLDLETADELATNIEEFRSEINKPPKDLWE